MDEIESVGIPDFVFDDEMPVTKSVKGQKGQLSGQGQKNDRPTNKTSAFRRALRTAEANGINDPKEDKRKQDEKLLKELSEVVAEYSRQRMRALHMSFRLYGNDDMKMTNKEMTQSLQENKVSIPSGILKPLVKKFEGPKGIDLEGMFRFLSEAHKRSGRDSVLAMYTRNDLAPRHEMSQEEIDEDLMWRIESQLIKAHEYMDLKELRTELQQRDANKCGKVDATVLHQLCQDLQLPIFGALLKNLIKRCDDEKNQSVSWPEFMAFLERGQANAWAADPSLKTLQDQRKTRNPVIPTPLDELTNKTKENIVSKLRKKSVISRADFNLTSPRTDSSHTDLPQPEFQAEMKVKDENSDPSFDNVITRFEFSTVSNTNEPGASSHLDDQPIVARPPTQSSRFFDSVKALLRGHSKKKPVDAFVQQLKPTAAIDIKIVAPSETSSPPKTPPSMTSDMETLGDQTIQDQGHTTDSLADVVINDSNVVSAPQKQLLQPPDEDVRVYLGEADNKGVKDEPAVSTPTTAEKQPKSDVVTFKNGEIVSVKTEQKVLDENKAEHASQQRMKTIKVTINGKELSFNTSEETLKDQVPDPPRERLKLQWIYGYRGNDCRKNIYILASGEILYFMSYIAVLYKKDTHQQRHYKEHTEEIKSMDLHSNKIIVASGQYASRRKPEIKAHIRVWRSDNLSTLHVLGFGAFEKSVACLAFSPGQDVLAAVDNSLEKKLTVWNTDSGTLQGEDLLNTDLVCDIGFNPKYPDLLITAGKEHILWWKVYPKSATIQNTASVEYDKFLRAKFTICVAFSDKGDLITGDSNGTIYIFGDGGNKITNYIKHAHDGPVFSILYHKGYILSGGRDGYIHCWQWSKNMDSSCSMQVPIGEGGVRMLRMHEKCLLVGTTMNSMLAMTTSDTDSPPLQGTVLELYPITQSHYDDVRGVAVVPDSETDVLTAGLDGLICGYSTATRICRMKMQYKGLQYTCVDSNRGGSLLALGTKDGHLHVLQKVDQNWTEVLDRKLTKESLDCVKISTDQLYIAIGSHDTSIYLYAYLTRSDGVQVWDFKGKLKGHASPVNAVDWSAEEVEGQRLLRSSSTNLEIKYWQLATLDKYPRQAVLMDVKWSTQSVRIDASLAGIIATRSNTKAEVTSLAVNGNIAISGDNSGQVCLFRYPCSHAGTFCHAYRSHAVVQNVAFTTNGKSVVTVGGKDSCMMQWEVV